VDYADRTAVFRRRLEPQRLDAYWLVSAPNVRYLSGFTGEDSTLLVTPGRTILITDSRYVEQAERECPVDEVVSRHTPMARAVGMLCKSQGVRRLGVTATNLIHAQYEALVSAATTVQVRSRPSGIAEEMRRRKSPPEVEAIRAAVRVAETAFGNLLRGLEPGRTERWLAARLEYEMRALGADGAAFETICAVDANASVPHARSGDAAVEGGSCVLFDWGARLAGYCCDLTRVIALSTIPTRWKAFVDVVLDAQAAVFQELRPGVRCAEVDAAGRAVIARAGFGRHFGHGIGHGVGLSVHEGPRLGPGGDTVLLPGMVVTVEPGIYLAGEVGVRLEQMALITANGHEPLTTLPQRPEDLPIGGR